MADPKPWMSTPKRMNPQRVALLKEFLKSFCESDVFIKDRRKILRKRAGLTDDDKKLVPKFRLIILEGHRKSVGEREVQSDLNFELVLAYMASFANDMPRRKEVETALGWASSHYKLNPWRRFEQHQAWAIVEAGTLMAAGSWCMDRFQRNPAARPGHERIENIKAVIRMKLQEHEMLTPEGKKVPTRGRGMSAKKTTGQEQENVKEEEEDVEVVEKKAEEKNKEEAKQEIPKGNPDEAETLPMECTPQAAPSPPQVASPFIESQWRLERGHSTSNLSQVLGEAGHSSMAHPDEDESDENENPEEEVLTDDDVIDPIQLDMDGAFQDNDTVQILSDDECLMSPSKQKLVENMDVEKGDGRTQVGVKKEQVMAPGNDTPPANDKVPGPIPIPKMTKTEETLKDVKTEPPSTKDNPLKREVGNTSTTCPETKSEKNDFEQALEAEVAEQLAEEVGSDTDQVKKETVHGKNTFKDRKPLADLQEVPQELLDRVTAVGTEDETTPEEEFLKGQKALRQMEKESQLEYEDPDKLYAQEAAEEEEGIPKKTKGRGKGRGRGRGRAGRGKKDSGSQDKSTKRNDEAGTTLETEEKPVQQGPGKKQKVSAKSPVTLTKPCSKRKTRGESVGHVPKSAKVSEKAPEECVVEDLDKEDTPEAKEPEQVDEGKHQKEKEDKDKEDKEKQRAAIAAAKKATEDAKKNLARDANLAILKSMVKDPMLRYPPQEELLLQRSWTLMPPDNLKPHLADKATRIQVLLTQSRSQTGSFYVKEVTDETIAAVSDALGFDDIQVNKQRGVSVGWAKRGGPAFAWQFAMMLANWVEPTSDVTPAVSA